MKTIDLSQTIDELTSAPTEGALTATTLLDALGITAAPTLDSSSLSAQVPGAAVPIKGVPGSLGRFVVQAQIGKGGMGRVVQARDPELLRTVALKLLLDPSEVNPARLSRFVTEAQLTAQLDHPNIVPVHEMGVTTDGQIYFVMKKVDGMSLRQIFDLKLSGDPNGAMWSAFRLLMAFVFIGNAVGYAHDRGVLHRDLKPENIMIGRFGELLVMDWGVARVMGDRSEELTVETMDSVSTVTTMDGAVVGTPGYMSPEQVRGDLASLDGRSDVFSLGAIVYEMLTTQRAFTADNPYALLLQTVEGPPVDPRERAPEAEIDDEIADIVMKAMATDPDDRFATAPEFAIAVGIYLENRRQADPDPDDCETPGAI